MNKYIVDHFNYRVIGMVFENALESDIYTLTGGESNEFILISATSPRKSVRKTSSYAIFSRKRLKNEQKSSFLPVLRPEIDNFKKF